MNRPNRTLLVLAVALADGASYAVYRTVTNLPRQGGRSGDGP